jgi:Tol biopolymer transport system component
MIGKTLAHYEILDSIGKGGMGEVYRARDTKLGRDVALKLLPRAFSSDPERLARFEREARTLAAVQHPNVASIYGFEHVVDHRFLVMELAEGQDLAKRIKAGPIDGNEALRIGQQIASGLEAAHEQGIIHRDLKPANVMLGADGKVKLLDFGLARAYENAGQEQNLEHSPTITAAMTMAGTILGTAAYMSPEQARGRTADRRSDVWALGVVMFEMLTGRKAFAGEVVSDVIARILEREPQWDELPESIHPLLRRLLMRCLAKDPADRFHDIADVRLELQGIIADPSGESFGFVPGGMAGPESGRGSGGRRGPRVALIIPWVVAVLCAGAAATLWLGRDAATPKPVAFAITAPSGYGLREFEVAPDGSAIVFSAIDRIGTSSLWLREMADAEPRQLPGTERATFPFWSPDATAIAFFADGKLKRIDLVTGSIQTVADAPNGRGGDWNVDGTILFTPEGNAELFRVPAVGGEPERVTTITEANFTHRFPHFLPGEQRFFYSVHGPDNGILERRLSDYSGETILELPDGMSEAYPAGDYVMYVNEGTLVGQRFAADGGGLLGPPRPIVSGISDTYPRTASAAFSVSGEGTLAYLQSISVETTHQWFDRNGAPLEVITEAGPYGNPQLSRDGTRIAYARYSAEGQSSMWTLDLERGTHTTFAKSDRASTGAFTWTADDAGIIYTEGWLLYEYDFASNRKTLLLDTSREIDGKRFVSPRTLSIATGGSTMIFDGWESDSDYDLWRLDLHPDGEPVRLAQTVQSQGHPRISPDERWVAYQSSETGRNEVYVRRTNPGSGQWVVSVDGGSAPAWSEDGSELFFLSSDEVLCATSFAGGGDIPRIGVPRELFQAPPGPVTLTNEASASPYLVAVRDGQFLFQVLAGEVATRSIQVVLDWPRLLER